MLISASRKERSVNLSGQPIRVLIADDHSLMRDGLRSMLGPERGIEVVAEAADGAECLANSARFDPMCR